MDSAGAARRGRRESGRQVPRERAHAGYSAATVYKYRAIIGAFFGRAWREGYITTDELLAVRAIGPRRGGGRDQPCPYRPGELRELRRILVTRWPRVPDDEATRWLGRWQSGRSPYGRIRAHTIRLQLDAVIGLALRCGLRRQEIFRLNAESMHPDNAYILVWDEDGPWCENCRTVEYTDCAREAIVPWVHWRAAIKPDHDRAGLTLSSATR